MGSLMAGWDAPIMDENTARLQRNKSLTREEINAFWKSRSPRAHNERDTNNSPYGSPVNSPGFVSDTDIRRAAVPFSRSQTDVYSAVQTHSSSNSPRTYESVEEMASKSDITGAWWTRSNLAFLNEPPREEMYGVAHEYTALFSVARLATGNA